MGSTLVARRTTWAVLLGVIAWAAGCGDHPDPATGGGSAQAESSTVVPQEIPGYTVTRMAAEELGDTWRPDCPIAPADLRRVQVNYFGFDGQRRRGDLVVIRELADEVGEIFEDLYRQRYPIDKMLPVSAYSAADDELSMQDNNTSAFNCRVILRSGNWSLHAYGRAIDLNPLLNPYDDRNGRVQPATGLEYLDRSRRDPGILHDTDPAVRAFTDRGWRWGGSWDSPVDYQHFERP